ncbi:hypothetical protein DCAR_0933328 [Daucus carota subsp. sativus]|uniref:Uncharacterized protein n=1 Tax=Daucus carota subsp. sativus TaxID=79200 RepID=A0A175YD51_DAUCS|nr:hypothetical protein DCAR_0933328 [Daucus carota subsp. sativus]
MAGVVDAWTKKVQELCSKGQTLWSSGSSPDGQLASEEAQKRDSGSYEAGAGSWPTGARFLRVNSPAGFHYSETSVYMVVECFSP